MASTLSLGPAMQHLSCEGWGPARGLSEDKLRFSTVGAAGTVGISGEGTWVIPEQGLQAGASCSSSAPAQPTSQPRSWQSAGSERGRSP